MYSKLAVNKYLHTVASCWILSIQSHDARNHEYKIKNVLLWVGIKYFRFTSFLASATAFRSTKILTTNCRKY